MNAKAASAVGNMCKPTVQTSARAKATRNRRNQLRVAMAALQQMVDEDDWKEVEPKTFVAIVVWMHREVYGVDVELDVRKQWVAAVTAAKRMLKTEFGGNADLMLEFVRWAWREEARRETWRREHGKGGGRLTWRRLFCVHEMVVDWRVARARTHGVR